MAKPTAQSQVANLLAERLPKDNDVQDTEEVTEETEALAEPEVDEEIESEAIEEEVSEEQQEVDGEYYDVSSFAEAVGLSPEEMYSVRVPLSLPDGRQEATLGELKDMVQSSSQTAAQAKKESAAIKRQLEEQTAERDQVMRMGQMPNEIAVEMANYRIIQDTLKGTDWAAMQAQDANAAITQRQNLLDMAREAEMRIGQMQQTHQAQQSQYVQQRIEQEDYKLLQKKPEWYDAQAREKAKNDAKSLLEDYGFNGQEIAKLTSNDDHRVTLMLDELFNLRNKMASVSEGAKKIRRAPKSLRSAGKPQVSVKDADAAAVIDQGKKSNRPQDKVRGVAAVLSRNRGN